MLIYQDVLCSQEIATDAYPTTEHAAGGVLEMESRMITEGGVTVNTGANASAEGGGEEMDDDVKTYVNIVYTHSLNKVDMDRKEAKTYFKSMWKKVVKWYNTKLFEYAGFDEDYKPPKDKKAAKAELDEALEELEDADRKFYEDFAAKKAKFEKRFKKISAFVKDNILSKAEFDNCEFYMHSSGVYGNAIIIPAKWKGAATTPVFYFFPDTCTTERA